MKKITIILLLLFFAGLSLLATVESSIGMKIWLFILTIGYLCLAALLWKNKYTRLITVILLLLWTINTGISVVFYSLFGSPLNVNLAITILSTNIPEAIGFLLNYWPIVCACSVLFFILMWLVVTLATMISTKILKIIAILFLLIIAYKACELIIKGKLSNPTFVMGEKLWFYTSLNNLGVFSRAQQEISIINLVNQYRPIYQLNRHETGIDTYVLVIGESARRQNFSLYGYHRLTTPNIEQQKPNLFIFKQAIAAAPITIMALSSALTVKALDDDNMSLLGDNIIELAKQSGFQTYWFSKQGYLGTNDTAITMIANRSDQKEWLNDGYDDALLSKLDMALNDKRSMKKLIVLHTNGSHSIACHQYPPEATFFTGSASKMEDCYDNSIRFTDSLLAQIYQRLANAKASVFYFSDHGQMKRDKYGEIDYIHGAIKPTKEAVDVPQFIWFSPALPAHSRKIGQYNTPYSTADNYYLIADWLGIVKRDEINSHSVFSSDFQPRQPIVVIDTQLNKFDYQTMPEDTIK